MFFLSSVVVRTNFRRFRKRARKEKSLSDLHEARTVNSYLIVRRSLCAIFFFHVTTFKAYTSFHIHREAKRDRDVDFGVFFWFRAFSTVGRVIKTHKGKRRKMAWLMVRHFITCRRPFRLAFNVDHRVTKVRAKFIPLINICWSFVS